jgi:hypothetical protein
MYTVKNMKYREYLTKIMVPVNYGIKNGGAFVFISEKKKKKKKGKGTRLQYLG